MNNKKTVMKKRMIRMISVRMRIKLIMVMMIIMIITVLMKLMTIMMMILTTGDGENHDIIDDGNYSDAGDITLPIITISVKIVMVVLIR